MRYFYIDTENRSVQNWAEYLPKLKSTDVLYLIYTINSQKVPYKYVLDAYKCKARIHFVESQCGSRNALDFVLTTKVAEQCMKATKSEHYIVSLDKDYNSVIRYHKDNGIHIQAIGSLSEVLEQSVVHSDK